VNVWASGQINGLGGWRMRLPPSGSRTPLAAIQAAAPTPMVLNIPQSVQNRIAGRTGQDAARWFRKFRDDLFPHARPMPDPGCPVDPSG
jgi:hypothetical protein